MVKPSAYLFAGILFAGLLVSACLAKPKATKPFAGTKTYIVHGYMAGPDDHWFEWLETRIEAGGGEAVRLTLPQPDDPDPAEWEKVLEDEIGTPDRKTYIVAHSLGSITVLRYLSGLEDASELGGLLLVSGFSGRLPAIPALDAYMDAPFDAGRIRQIASRRAVISAKDDPIVPHRQSQTLAGEIDADFLPAETGGHFLARDGFDQFPLVLQTLRDMIRNADNEHTPFAK